MKATDARVLLTGARGGIGQAMARALTAAGAAVMGARPRCPKRARGAPPPACAGCRRT